MKSAVANILLEKDILLESGTNEMEVLVFRVGNLSFGINVAKVREVLTTPKLTSLPRAHESIKGVFQLRNRVIPCVSLVDHLKLDRLPDGESCAILTEINMQQTAFLVDAVERIHRMNWKSIHGVPNVIPSRHASITSVMLCDQRMISMLDFERILAQIGDYARTHVAVPNPHGVPREKVRLLLADDSPTVREAIGTLLRDSGYTDITVFENGQDAWDGIAARYDARQSLDDVGDLLISDVEMPRMDGFHLCKRIKEHAALQRLPVLLYSSIVTPDNFKKGQAVQADAQVAKPDLNRVVTLVDELMLGTHTSVVPAAAPPAAVVPETPPPAAPAPPAAKSAPAAAAAVRPATEAVRQPRVPRGANGDLWRTFCKELSQRMEISQMRYKSTDESLLSDDALHALFRELHSIKGAAAVVPCEPISRVTHALESRIEAARGAERRIESRDVDRYFDWLEAVISSEAPVDDVLACAAEVERQLTAP